MCLVDEGVMVDSDDVASLFCNDESFTVNSDAVSSLLIYSADPHPDLIDSFFVSKPYYSRQCHPLWSRSGSEHEYEPVLYT